MKIKEKIITVLVIAIFIGNCFMLYRNYTIAKEADRLSRAEMTYIIQNAPAWNATYQWAQGCAYIRVCPSTAQIQDKLDALNAQTKK